MMDASDPWLLHFTHIDNLPGIIGSGLLPDNHGRGDVTECGQPSIKERRRSRAVPLSPGGMVADYVPFYFAPRSPMLRSILGGRVKEYGGDQTHLIYLVTRLSHVIRYDLPWLATDSNAVLRTAKFTDERHRLADHIDWAIMEEQFWGNTAEDGSRRERRMAELLVHQSVPWPVLSHVAVCCAERASEVRAVAATTDHHLKMLVRPDWYFYVPGNCPCQGLWKQKGGQSHDH
jgi:hypothetical protein